MTKKRYTIDLRSLQEACKAGDLSKLKDWDDAELIPDFRKLDSAFMTPHAVAAAVGQTKVLNWLAHTCSCATTLDIWNDAALNAALAGQLASLQWLVAEPSLAVDLTAFDNRACWEAASRGELLVLKWLVNDSGQPVDVTANDNAAAKYAAKNNHLEVLKWLVEHGRAPSLPGSGDDKRGQLVDVTAENHWALESAVERDNSEAIKWLINESGYYDDAYLLDTFCFAKRIRQYEEPLHRFLRLEQQAAIETANADRQQQVQQLLREIQQTAQVISKEFSALQPATRSPVCRQAFSAGLITALEDLLQLTVTTPSTRDRKI